MYPKFDDAILALLNDSLLVDLLGVPVEVVIRVLAGMIGALTLYLYTQVYNKKLEGWREYWCAIVNIRLILSIFFAGILVGIIVEPADFKGGVLAGLVWETLMKKYSSKPQVVINTSKGENRQKE